MIIKDLIKIWLKMKILLDDEFIIYEVIIDEMNKIKNCFLKFFNIFFFCKFLGGMYVVCEYSGVFCGKYEFSSIFIIWIYIYWFRWLFKCEYW